LRVEKSHATVILREFLQQPVGTTRGFNLHLIK